MCKYLLHMERVLIKLWMKGQYRRFWVLARLLLTRSLRLRILAVIKNSKLSVSLSLSKLGALHWIGKSLNWKKMGQWPSVRVEIPKPNRKDKRPLTVPHKSMRIYMGMLQLLLELIVRSSDTLGKEHKGSLPDCSVPKAWRGVIKYLQKRRGRGYISQYDFKSYFDNFNYSFIYETLTKLIKMDVKMAIHTIKLIRTPVGKQIGSSWALSKPTKGIGHGYATSPILAALILEHSKILREVGTILWPCIQLYFTPLIGILFAWI